MSTRLRAFLIFIGLLAFTVLHPDIAHAQDPGQAIPEGFFPIADAAGVQMYQKNYQGGSPDYVQVVNLSQGAQIVPLHGEVRENRPGKGSYGGDDPRVQSRSLANYWDELTSLSPQAFCVTNGQFFYMKESPTRLPFPLKVNGVILSDGYGINEFPDQKLLLELWEGRADIISLSQESLYSSDAPNIVAGLTQTASKRIDRYVGRTFVGVDDQNQDGTYETVLIFNSSLSRQVDAAGVLESFGADKVMMLDGGGSTQLSCQGKSYIYSERLIPQAIGVIAAQSQALPTVEAVQASPESSDQAVALAGVAGAAPSQEASEQPVQSEQALVSPAEVLPLEKEASTASIQPAQPVQPLPMKLSDVLYVPLMMSPVLAFLIFFIGRLRMGAS